MADKETSSSCKWNVPKIAIITVFVMIIISAPLLLFGPMLCLFSNTPGKCIGQMLLDVGIPIALVGSLVALLAYGYNYLACGEM